jgi:hypothetical protein
LRDRDALSGRFGLEKFFIDQMLECLVKQLAAMLVCLVDGKGHGLLDLMQSD